MVDKQILLDLAQILFTLVSLIPMPWQVSAFLLLITLVLHLLIVITRSLIVMVGKFGKRITIWVFRLLLLPEFLIVSFLRNLNLPVFAIFEMYDVFIETVSRELYNFFRKISKANTRRLRVPKIGMLIILSIPILAWYLPLYTNLPQDSLIMDYIRHGFRFYYHIRETFLSR